MDYDLGKFSCSYNRDDLICRLSTGKNVLHIGATDSPYTADKFDSGLLLHGRLTEHAKMLYGIDIDASAIEYLRQRGIENIHCFDMNRMGEIDFKADVIVFGEIIEHLQNFQTALNTLKMAMSPETKLLISTPNRFYLISFLMAFLQQKESVHDDHKVVFSYGTLRQLLEENGFMLDGFHFTFLPRSHESFIKKIVKALCKLSPCVSETLLAEVRLRPSEN